MYHKFGHVSCNYEYIFGSVNIFVSVCVCVHSVDVVCNESSFMLYSLYQFFRLFSMCKTFYWVYFISKGYGGKHNMIYDLSTSIFSYP